MANEIMWKTSVTELLDIFHESLLTLIPIMERAHLPWKEPDSYDEWDNITETLFQVLVVGTLQWVIYQKEEGKLEIPKYDFRYENYSSHSFIAIKQRTNNDENYLVFVGFATKDAPLDTVEYVEIDITGNMVSNSKQSTPYKNSEFIFKHRISINKVNTISDFEMDI